MGNDSLSSSRVALLLVKAGSNEIGALILDNIKALFGYTITNKNLIKGEF